MENPSACLQSVSSTARAKESFQRAMFIVRELNELGLSSHCRKIAVAQDIYNNFGYSALATSSGRTTRDSLQLQVAAQAKV
jgi:hypothetical protein